MIRDLYEKYKALFWQIHRFILAGIVNTIFGYLVYAFGVLIGLDYTPALILSYVVGVTFSYMTFRRFVFSHSGSKRKSYAKFVATYVFLFLINWVALHVLVVDFEWNKLVAQAVIVPCCAAMSFVINRAFVFRT